MIYTSDFLCHQLRDESELQQRILQDLQYPATKENSLIWQMVEAPQAMCYLSYLIQQKNIKFITKIKEILLNPEHEALIKQVKKFTSDTANFIHFAAIAKDKDLLDEVVPIIDLALQHNPALLFQKNNTESVLMAAVKSGNVRMTRYLLEKFHEIYATLPQNLKQSAFEKLYASVYDEAKKVAQLPAEILVLLENYGVNLYSTTVSDEQIDTQYTQEFLIKDKHYWQAYLLDLVRAHMNSPTSRDKKFAALFLSLNGEEGNDYLRRTAAENKNLLEQLTQFLTKYETVWDIDERARRQECLNTLRRKFVAARNEAQGWHWFLPYIPTWTFLKIPGWAWLKMTDLSAYGYFLYEAIHFEEEYSTVQNYLINEFEKCMHWGYGVWEDCSRPRTEVCPNETSKDFIKHYKECHELYEQHIGLGIGAAFTGLIFLAGIALTINRMKDWQNYPNQRNNLPPPSHKEIFLGQIGWYSHLLLKSLSYLIPRLSSYTSPTSVAEKEDMLMVLTHLVGVLSDTLRSDRAVLEEISKKLQKPVADITQADLVEILQALKPLVDKYKNGADLSLQPIPLAIDAADKIKPAPSIVIDIPNNKSINHSQEEKPGLLKWCFSLWCTPAHHTQTISNEQTSLLSEYSGINYH